MGVTLDCCLRNLQQFQYGELLDKLVMDGYSVKASPCLNQCIGCRKQHTAVVDGLWTAFDTEAAMEQFIIDVGKKGDHAEGYDACRLPVKG
ncbi:hypothetical protein ACFO9Q_09525 [Paenibacillus sp. GCM10023252]|uniref:hypothetical protein n=1 Tax=Paenibacillus sp. GCM10023252 TaxID=3252649 RepID=UPI003605AC5D